MSKKSNKSPIARYKDSISRLSQSPSPFKELKVAEIQFQKDLAFKKDNTRKPELSSGTKKLLHHIARPKNSFSDPKAVQTRNQKISNIRNSFIEAESKELTF